MTIIEDLLQKTRYVGKYKAIVTHIDDPKKMRRIRVKCPIITNKESLPWALPCDTTKVNWLPAIGDIVWIEFEGGMMIDKPIWVGLAVAKDDVDQDFIDNYINTYRKDTDYNGNSIEWKDNGMIITDLNANKLTMDDVGVKVEEFNGNTVTIDSNGIIIEDSNGNTITKDSSGIIIKDSNANEVIMDSSGVKIKSGDATAWAPCIVKNCYFTGAPHGGQPAGIIKLTGG